MLKKPVSLLLFLTLCMVGAVAADYETFNIQQVSPDTNNLERDTHVTFQLMSDEWTTYEIGFWVEHPDGTTEHVETISGETPQDQPQTFVFTLEQDEMTQFGDYTFTVNETDTADGESDNMVFQVPPTPDMRVSKSTPIYKNDVIGEVLLELDVVEFYTGSRYDFDVLRNGTVTFYEITHDGGGEFTQSLYLEKNMSVDAETKAWKSLIPITEFEVGQYEYVTNVTISSPPHDATADYQLTRSGSFKVRQNFGESIESERWQNETAPSIVDDITSVGSMVSRVEDDLDELQEDVEEVQDELRGAIRDVYQQVDRIRERQSESFWSWLFGN